MSTPATMPRSRTEKLIVQETSDETLVYDLAKHKAHCLNRSAAAVWSMCDGRSTVTQAASVLNERFGLPADERIVHLALDHLAKAKLLDDGHESLPDVGSSRREVIQRIGLIGGLAIALPLVSSIVAPMAAAAATCIPNGFACEASADCCSGRCINNMCM